MSDWSNMSNTVVETLTDGQKERLAEANDAAWKAERNYGRTHERTKAAYAKRDQVLLETFEDSFVPGRVAKGVVYAQIAEATGLQQSSVGTMIVSLARKQGQ